MAVNMLDIAANVYMYGVATGMLLFGTVLLVRGLRFQWHSKLTIGTVKGWQPEYDSDARNNYSQLPIIEYRSENGRVHEFVGTVSGPDELLLIGYKIKVRYDMRAPENARRANELLAFALPVFLIAFAIFFFVDAPNMRFNADWSY